MVKELIFGILGSRKFHITNKGAPFKVRGAPFIVDRIFAK